MNTVPSTPDELTTPHPDSLDPFWAVVKRMPRYLRLAMALIRDERTPMPAKVALTVGGVYTISPIDAIPGFIPVAGQLDDLLVLLFALREALIFCPPALADEHLTRLNLKEPGVDADIKTTLRTAQWVTLKTFKAVSHFAVVQGKLLFQVSKRTALALEDRWRPPRTPELPGPN
jgi:uncharacterized membrane protein YkvA (DUF1232 family)